MAQYYYFVATLPLLFFDSPEPFSSADFLEAASAWLTDADLELLRTTRIDGTSTDASTRTSRHFGAMERGLRNELVRLRASRLGVDADAYSRHDDTLPEAPLDAAVVANEAMSEDSPLRAEQILDRYRWAMLDDLEVGHYFDVEKLLIYYYRLQILERRSAMTRERGESRFELLYEKTMETMHGMED